MLLILAAALLGGFGAAVLAITTSPLLAVLLAPIFGSASALLAAFYLAWRRGSYDQGEVDLDAQTDAMVAALRGIAEPVEVSSPAPKISIGRKRIA